MGWFTAVKLLLQVAGSLTRYMQQRQLIGAGEAKAIAANLSEANENLDEALAARRAVKHDADSLRDDPHRRD